jgi:uncharacterized protein YkwD
MIKKKYYICSIILKKYDMKSLITTVAIFISSFCFVQTRSDDLDEMFIQRNKKEYNKIDFDSLSNSLVDIINNYRIKNKLHTLSLDTSLVRYSKNWGKTLCDRNTLIHSDFTGTKIIGENIYGLFTYGTFMCNVEYFNKQPQIIFNDWRTSITGHNETMLDKSATKIGLYIYTEYNAKFKLRTVMAIE